MKALLGFLILFSNLGFASRHSEAISECLKAWKKHPFKGDVSELEYNVVQPKVKILGIGGSDFTDTESTAPRLTLITTSVNVLSKSEMNLINPNGWYCIKGSTAVLGSIKFNVHCRAQIASTSDGNTSVLGATEKSGVSVLGTIRLHRFCD